jgi:DNA-binding GntR family transcriptional regulator
LALSAIGSIHYCVQAIRGRENIIATTTGGSKESKKKVSRERQSAGIEIYERLKEDIAGLRFMPGDRLVELELCERYEISRTPVREALRRLEDDGLVVTQAKGGRFVKGRDIDEYEEVYTIRCVLEMYVVRELCGRVDQLDIDALRNDWRSQVNAVATPLDGSFIAADEKFHLGLAEATGNTFLVELIERVNARLRGIRAVDFTVRDRLVVSEEQHLAIVDAIAAGDGDAAAKLVDDHITQSKSEISNVLLRMLTRGSGDRAGDQ